MSSAGDKEQVKKGNKVLMHAAIWLAVALVAYAITTLLVNLFGA
jgi:hypothetical protein